MHDGYDHTPVSADDGHNRFGSSPVASLVQSKTKHLTQPTSALDREKLLIYLDTQVQSFPFLEEYVKTKFITPGSFFLPQTLRQIDNDLTHNQELIVDTLDYLDTVKLYSAVVYGDGDAFIDELIRNATNSRVIRDRNLMLAQSGLDDYTFESAESATKFMENNPFVFSIYIYSLVKLALQVTQE